MVRSRGGVVWERSPRRLGKEGGGVGYACHLRSANLSEYTPFNRPVPPSAKSIGCVSITITRCPSLVVPAAGRWVSHWYTAVKIAAAVLLAPCLRATRIVPAMQSPLPRCPQHATRVHNMQDIQTHQKTMHCNQILPLLKDPKLEHE